MRVAIVGLGRMGRVHADVLSSLGVDVVAGFDLLEENLAEFSLERSIPTFHTSRLFEELSAAGVSGVVIATTTPSRFNVFNVLLKRLRLDWILSEKPIASSLWQLNQITALANATGVRIGINHQMRFLPQYQHIAAIISDGNLGSLESMVVSGSNFGLGNNVSHYFEAFRWLTGREIAAVRGFLEREPVPSHRGPGFRDYAGSLLANDSSGTRLFVDFSSRVGHGVWTTYNFQYGKVMVDEMEGRLVMSMRQPGASAQPTSRYGLPSVVQDLHFSGLDLVDSSSQLVKNLMLNDGPYPDLRAASHSLRSLVATVASSELGSRAQNTSGLALRKHVFRKFDWA